MLGLATAGLIGAGIGAVTDLLGIGHNASATKKKNELDAQLARENMQMQRDINAENIAYQKEANEQNLAFQRETNAQNEALMREGWSRDDTAYQRKAQDLQSAGLSKTLAAGGSAMSSQAIKLQSPSVSAVSAGQAPQNTFRHTPFLLDKANLIQMSQEFVTKQLENQILAERAKQEKNKTKVSDTETKNIINAGGEYKSGLGKVYSDIVRFIDDNGGLDYLLNNGGLKTLWNIIWKGKSSTPSPSAGQYYSEYYLGGDDEVIRVYSPRVSDPRPANVREDLRYKDRYKFYQ